MDGPVSFSLNGKPVQVRSDGGRMLLWVLRGELGLTGTRFGCGVSRCGACTVLLDGEAVRACATPLAEVTGRKVLTVEGLEREGRLHPLQQAFLEKHAFQCGYCTSGMLLSAYALLLRRPSPTRAEIVQAMDGNLCRCGAHVRILEAIEQAAAALAAPGGGR